MPSPITCPLWLVVAMIACVSTVAGTSARGEEPSRPRPAVHGPPPYLSGWAEPELPGKRLNEFLVLGLFPEPEKPAAATEQLRPLVLDEDYLAAQGGEVAAHPKAGDTVKTKAGVELTWKSTAGLPNTDPNRASVVEHSVDLAAAVGGKAGKVLYAYTEFEWDRDTEGVLAYDVTDDARIWVNGQLVQERAAILRWPRDERHVARIPLKRGSNRVLVKMRSGFGMRFLGRVMTLDDARAFPVLAIRPRRLTSMGQDAEKFRLLTDEAFGSLHPECPVEISVLLPGGKIAATATAKLGETVTLKTAGWPEGPCEIRLTTKLPLTGNLSAYLPWYHGDLRAAAEKLKALKAEDSSTATDLVAYYLATAAGARLAKATSDDSEALLNLAHHLLMEQAEQANRTAGGPGGEHADGFMRLAWRATNDLSPQFCAVHLPMEYSRQRTWPLVVYLHGNDRNNRAYESWGDDQRRRGLYMTHDAIVIEPFGRGNLGYWNMSEEDVLKCIEVAKQTLPVDADRVYLTGYSMGGMGAESIGARHPYLFAAIAPAGAFVSLRDTATAEWAGLTPVAQYRQLRREPGFESLWSTFTYSLVGEKDAERNVQGALDLTRRMQSWGYPVQLWSVPNIGHELGFVYDGPGLAHHMNAVMQHRRDPAPVRVRLRGMALTEGRTHWAQVTQRDASWEQYTLDASVIGEGTFGVTTRHVLEVRLTPPAALKPGQSIQVMWNGQAYSQQLAADGSVTLRAAGYEPGDRAIKTPGRCGPSERVFAHRFVLVTCTGDADGAMNDAAAAVTKSISEQWARSLHASPRTCSDSELTADEAAANSLILIGTPKAQTPAAKALAGAGVVVAADSVTLAGQASPAADPLVLALRPHSQNAGQYLMVVKGATAGALQRLVGNSGISGLGGTSVSPLPGGEFDYVIMDKTKSVQVGLFDWAWNVSEKTRGVLAADDLASRGRGPRPATQSAP